MRKLLAGIMILLVSGVVLCGDEMSEEQLKEVLKKDKTLQRNVKSITSKMEKEDAKLAEAQKKHKEAIAKLKKGLIDTYESSMKKFTKKGDIRTATAIMKMVDKIKNKSKDHAKEAKTADFAKISISNKQVIVNKLSSGSLKFTDRKYTYTNVSGNFVKANHTMAPVRIIIDTTVKCTRDGYVYLTTESSNIGSFVSNSDSWEKFSTNDLNGYKISNIYQLKMRTGEKFQFTTSDGKYHASLIGTIRR